ncbi:MAG: hypothetical protein WBF42_02615 [Terracidiphilus sp.]
MSAPPMQGEPGAVLQIDYSNPGLVPANWTLLLRADGSGHFHSERGTAKPGETLSIQPVAVDRDVRLSSAFTAHVFDIMHKQKNLNEGCESHLKVAYQGTKRFTFTSPEDGAESCEFNYSKNHEIQSLSDSFVAVATTILAGARLELLLQHDPLGLDQEMQFLVDGTKDGRVQQMCAIRGILQKLQDDPSVMERVRKRAGMLLAESN